MMKKFVILFLGLLLTGCLNNNNDNLSIISTSFPGYDFARAITKNSDIEVKMLLKPGAETHDFEPTPQDIINIKNSDIFIYVGGDSDEWIDDILDDINLEKTKVIKLMDLVKVEAEEIVPGMQSNEDEISSEEEYDEHVWTSPINAITIVNKLEKDIVKMDSENKKLYESNAEDYTNELKSIDSEIKNIVETSKRKEIIFGDRFPFRYFTDEYGLSYYAAFPGCSDQTEANVKTVSFLVDKVREDEIPVVFHIELSDGKIAKAIAKETPAKVLEFHSAHNISKKDFENGITYVDIMRKNILALKEALN